MLFWGRPSSGKMLHMIAIKGRSVGQGGRTSSNRAEENMRTLIKTLCSLRNLTVKYSRIKRYSRGDDGFFFYESI